MVITYTAETQKNFMVDGFCLSFVGSGIMICYEARTGFETNETIQHHCVGRWWRYLEFLRARVNIEKILFGFFRDE